MASKRRQSNITRYTIFLQTTIQTSRRMLPMLITLNALLLFECDAKNLNSSFEESLANRSITFQSGLREVLDLSVSNLRLRARSLPARFRHSC